MLGGMGRTRNGSYAELVTVPASNVVPVRTSLTWTDLAARPEAYATAWAGLHQNLGLQPGQAVLVRGGTSALGQAAVNVAAGDGVTVIATTRSPGRAALLRDLGAAHGEFPLADIPLQEMITKAESGRYQAEPARVFGFEEIVQAHQAMEEGLAAGKIVVAVS